LSDTRYIYCVYFTMCYIPLTLDRNKALGRKTFVPSVFIPDTLGLKKHSIDMNLYRMFMPRHSVPNKYSVYIYVYRVFYFPNTRYNVTLGTNGMNFFGMFCIHLCVTLSHLYSFMCNTLICECFVHPLAACFDV
jgi:hypothetical protein